MCILPNFEASDLKMLRRNEKKAVNNAEAELVEIIVPEQALEPAV